MFLKQSHIATQQENHVCGININTSCLAEAMVYIVITTSWMRGLQRFRYSEDKVESVKMRNQS
jgi:hypothetical protein